MKNMFIKEIYVNTKNAIEVAKLINNVKYDDYKLTVKILKEYDDTNPSSDWKPFKGSLYKIANQIESKFLSYNKAQIWLNRFNIYF